MQLTDASSGVIEGLALVPTLVMNAGVLNECRKALNKWSSQFRIAMLLRKSIMRNNKHTEELR